MKRKIKNNEGFTLIELVLYVGVTSFILTAVVLFIMTLLQVQVKNQVIGEVNQQGAEVLQNITQAIRNSNGINSPAIGTSDTQLSLGMNDISKNPTIFNIGSGVIHVTEGINVYDLTNSKVSVVNLSFMNLSRSSTRGVIRISFILSYVNQDSRDELTYSKSFEATASVR